MNGSASGADRPPTDPPEPWPAAPGTATGTATRTLTLGTARVDVAGDAVVSEQAPVSVIAGMLGGMAWAAIPALLRTRFNTSEILVSLMLE